MSITFKAMARVAVGTTLSTAYTVPASTVAVLKELNFTNTATVARKIRAHIVPTAESATTSNAIIYDMTIPANSPFPLQYHMVLNAGDRIQVVADFTGVTLTASGIEEAL